MSNIADALAVMLKNVSKGQKNYALLDCSLDSTIYPTLKQSGNTLRNLYTKDWQSGLEDIAPYLVELSSNTTFSQELPTWDWYSNWGYFLQSSNSQEEIAQSLDVFTLVQTPENIGAFFRFFDPRVIRPYLSAAPKNDLALFFSKVSTLIVPMLDDGLQGEGAIEYSFKNQTLALKEQRF